MGTGKCTHLGFFRHKLHNVHDRCSWTRDIVVKAWPQDLEPSVKFSVVLTFYGVSFAQCCVLDEFL